MPPAVPNRIRVPLGMLLLLFMSPSLLSQEAQIDKAGDEKPEPASLPMAGTMGYSTPTCVKCPTAKFSKEAVKHKYEGTVTLRITADENGHAKDIAVEKGQPFGLTEQAIAAVKKWRFKPATGPDGKPAAVRINVQVAFRLY
jgi:TonB family protein